MSSSVFIDVAGVNDIPRGQGRAFEVGNRVIAVFNCDGVFYAIDDHCPHIGASLSPGHLENCVVACPWHGWRFDVRDGTWMDNPRIKTDSFPVRVVGSRIEVVVPVTAGDPIVRETNKTTPLGENTEQKKTELTVGDFQKLIRQMYHEKDVARGVEGTFMWLMEEVGELSTALRERDRKNQLEEFADVLAWLCTIANVCEIDLTEAIQRKYGSGCPGCGRLACTCPNSEKP